MARKWTNRNLEGALHYVTGNVHKRKSIFRSDENCIAFLEELQRLRVERACKLIAFVVMPDHSHAILNPRGGDIQTATGILKSFAAKRLVDIAPDGYFRNGEENQVWQESFKSLALWSGWMITQKVNYIHSNPVRAGICDRASEYRWSSFHSFYRQEADRLLQVDTEWWWPGDMEKLAETLGKEETDKMLEYMEKKKRG